MELAADAAEAVWAPSLAVARHMLLRHWLRGEATEAWFWRRIAPTQTAEHTWPARAVALMLMADEQEAFEITASSVQRRATRVCSLLALIADHGMAAPFIEAIDDGQAFEALKVIETREAPAKLAHRRLHIELPARRARTPRARLLEVMTTLSTRLESPVIERQAIDPSASAPEPIRSTGWIERSEETAHAWPESTEAPAAGTPPPRPLSVPESQVEMNHGLASPWSGLWLLLPLLLRHGLDAADDPLTAWAGALRAACRRFGVPDDDVIHTALADLDLPPGDDAYWFRSARLAAIDDARLPLLRIARRSGAAWVSPERIDIEFPAASLDLRIRRAGFDINPGFVPWLGRIVHFHYPS